MARGSSMGSLSFWGEKFRSIQNVYWDPGLPSPSAPPEQDSPISSVGANRAVHKQGLSTLGNTGGTGKLGE